jgi:glucose 1-dehydrogenase
LSRRCIVAGRLEGKVAFVTGGSSGISRAVALRFAEEGASIAIADIRPTPREGGAPTDEVAREMGSKAGYVETDVTDAPAVDRAIGETLASFGDLHIVFCGAGIVEPTGDSREIDPAAFDSHFALNVKGTFLPVQRALRHFTPGRYGKVITVASNFGLVGVVGLTTYCASKAAIIGMTKSLAAEFGPYGINVNALCPGATKTAINVHHRSDPEVQELWQRMTPLRMVDDDYIAEPRDIANAALFLASDESRFMTGATLVVDGGWIAH